jgi:hypothetical protein
MNKHTFGIRLVAQRTYALIISGIGEILYWIENIAMRMSMTVALSMGIFFTKNIDIVNTFVSAISQISKLSVDMVNDIELRVSALSELMKISTDVNDKMLLTFYIPYTRVLARVASLFSETIDITVTAVLATLIKLEVYDPQLLGTLDPYTLGDMDSVIVT